MELKLLPACPQRHCRLAFPARLPMSPQNDVSAYSAVPQWPSVSPLQTGRMLTPSRRNSAAQVALRCASRSSDHEAPLLIAGHRQRGFALLTVLILTFIASMVVFVSIKENMMQERMSGNQKKMINARLAAEKGIYDTQSLIQQRITAGNKIEDIVSTLNRQLTGVYIISAANYNKPNLTFTSQGQYQDATVYLKTRFSVITGTYPFSAGIISCENMTLSAGGVINSYDPSKGAYSSNNNNKKASVQTINGSATINGGAPLYGDLRVNGSATLSGSATVTGNITTTGDLTLNSNNSNDRISSVDVGGNLAFTNTAQISGHANVSGNVRDYPGATVGSMSYGGTFTHTNGDINSQLNKGNFSNIVHQPTPAPTVTSPPCDPLDIAHSAPDFSALTTNGTISGGHYYPAGSGSLVITPSAAELYTGSGLNKTSGISPQTINALGTNNSGYVLDSLNMEGTTLHISGGDVTLVVKGDFIMQGGAPTIQVDAGSSLNIIVAGKTELSSSGQVIVGDAGAGNNNNKSPLTIYSANTDSQNGVKISGAMQGGYAAIYAPLTNVYLTAGGQFSGAVRGKNVAVDGGTSLHYDESLQNVNKGSASSRANLLSIYDYYP